MTAPLSLAPKPTVRDEIKQACVDILRKALDLAESGHVESVVVIAKHDDGCWSDERSGTIGMSEAIGQIEIVKQAWINQYTKLTRVDDT